MRLALYQPDIPQNAGAALRLAACFGIAVDIIEPCGFVWSHSRMRRAGMDYMDHVDMVRHAGWEAFCETVSGRLLLLTTKASERFDAVEYNTGDILLLGRESAGVPQDVHDRADLRLRIPMRAETRSLNVVNAAAIVLGEALRQTNGFPE